MEKLLQGKRAIVTGGNRGLGFAIASALAIDGAQVMLVARTSPQLNAAAAQIREVGGIATHFAADISDPASAEAIVQATLNELGGVDILVNNAGIFVWKRFLDLPRQDFERSIALNLAAPFHLSQAAARVMVRQGQGGSIINIASIHGKVADPNTVAHCASKFGLIGLTKAAAEALREYNIRVNALCPGAIESNSADRRAASPREKVTQADIATLCVYLTSDLSNSITGAAIDVPGNTHTVIKV